MAKFYPMQRVRYVGTSKIKRISADGRPLTKHGDEGTFMSYAEVAGVDICAVKMDSGVGLGCAECELEPILPCGLEPIEEIMALLEPESEFVELPVKKRTRH